MPVLDHAVYNCEDCDIDVTDYYKTTKLEGFAVIRMKEHNECARGSLRHTFRMYFRDVRSIKEFAERVLKEVDRYDAAEILTDKDSASSTGLEG